MTHLLLNVPFSEKDNAKARGARWDPGLKKWYVPEGFSSLPFTPWIQELSDIGRYEVYSEFYYIGINTCRCWKCNELINLYAFCLPRGHKYLNIDYLDPDEEESEETDSKWQLSEHDGLSMMMCESSHTIYSWSENPSFSGVSRITDIDPRALSQMRHYSPIWRPGYSHTAGTSYYANHCPHCARIQGDFMIFSEPGGAFLPASPDQAGRIQLHKINEPVFLKGGTCWTSHDFFEHMKIIP